MGKEQLAELSRLNELQKELSNGWIKYWNQYSSYSDWHYWLLIVLSILPLIILFFFIDRRKLFHLGFFGFSVHILHSYVDVAAVFMGKWTYPHKLISYYPISFALDASLIPVTFMLVYQWTLNNKKSFYLFAPIPAIFFAFIAKPILILINITKPVSGGGMKAYFTLFINHLLIAYVSKLLTDLFRKLSVDETSVNEKQISQNVSSKSLNWFKVKRKAY